jgi:4-amino-4-deoxy-L-arabinose transferase-like glycosyltransferase
MSVFFGTATVAVTYFLARELYDRTTALISTFLLTFSTAHILIASHVGWSASLTPFFGILTLCLAVKSLKNGWKPLFFATGVTSGIMLQTHPASIFLIPGLGIYTITLLRRSFNKGRRLFLLLLICAGFLVGYINMVYFNIVNPLGSFNAAENATWTGLSSPLTWSIYASRIQSLTTEYLRMMGDAMTLDERFTVIWSNFKACLYLALTLVAVIYAVKIHRKADLLLLILLGSAWLILPVGVKGFGFPTPWAIHYVQLLLQISFILISSPLNRLLQVKTNKIHRISLGLIIAMCGYSMITSIFTLAGQ